MIKSIKVILAGIRDFVVVKFGTAAKQFTNKFLRAANAALSLLLIGNNGHRDAANTYQLLLVTCNANLPNMS